jgi:D-aminoacyl-tRNA deacylase
MQFMRALVQRVTSAAVDVEGERIAELTDPGLVVLLGVTHDDDAARASRLAAKVAGARILRDERSVQDSGGGVLVVSQFTLYADTRKGRRPSWSGAAPGHVAEPLVQAFTDALQALGIPVQTGKFGADMAVSLVNDGPVTVAFSEPPEPLPRAPLVAGSGHTAEEQRNRDGGEADEL